MELRKCFTFVGLVLPFLKKKNLNKFSPTKQL